jgi:hypothetical protein
VKGPDTWKRPPAGREVESCPETGPAFSWRHAQAVTADAPYVLSAVAVGGAIHSPPTSGVEEAGCRARGGRWGGVPRGQIFFIGDYTGTAERASQPVSGHGGLG